MNADPDNPIMVCKACGLDGERRKVWIAQRLWKKPCKGCGKLDSAGWEPKLQPSP